MTSLLARNICGATANQINSEVVVFSIN